MLFIHMHFLLPLPTILHAHTHTHTHTFSLTHTLSYTTCMHVCQCTHNTHVCMRTHTTHITYTHGPPHPPFNTHTHTHVSTGTPQTTDLFEAGVLRLGQQHLVLVVGSEAQGAHLPLGQGAPHRHHGVVLVHALLVFQRCQLHRHRACKTPAMMQRVLSPNLNTSNDAESAVPQL